MTPERQRIAIAEACGWNYVKDYDPCRGGYWHSPENYCHDAPLDYLNDLNAMHEAETRFDNATVDEQSLYWDYLCLVCWPEEAEGSDDFRRDYKMLRATAAQRAEAFLRAVGKWEEE